MKLLCGLYALIIVVLGIVFATATSLTAQERQHKYYLEVRRYMEDAHGNIHHKSTSEYFNIKEFYKTLYY